MVLPVLIALVAYWRRGGFEPETGLLNRDDVGEPGGGGDAARRGETEAASAECGGARFPPLPPARRVALRWARRRGPGRSDSPRWPSLSPTSANRPNYQLSREQARAAADAFLKIAGPRPRRVPARHVPSRPLGAADSLAGKYFLERLSPVAAAAALFERNRPMQVWITRYFKSLDQEEITVSVHPRNRQGHGLQPHDSGDAPGRRHPPGTRARNRRPIRRLAGLGHAPPWISRSLPPKQKKARRDYSLEWEARPGDPRNVDETRWRVEVNVAGDHVVSARGFWKLPEAWQRGREQQNALAIAIAVLKIVTLAALIVYGLWLLLQGTRHGMVRWHAAHPRWPCRRRCCFPSLRCSPSG